METQLSRVLLVNDNQLDAQLLREAFADCGFSPAVVWAPMGSMGITFLRQFEVVDEPLLVVLDLNMPRVSGIEILREMRSTPRFKDTPVLIFTTSTLKSDRETCEQLGISGFVRKPTSFEEYRVVVDTIRTILGDLPKTVIAPIGDEG